MYREWPSEKPVDLKLFAKQTNHILPALCMFLCGSMEGVEEEMIIDTCVWNECAVAMLSDRIIARKQNLSSLLVLAFRLGFVFVAFGLGFILGVGSLLVLLSLGLR